MRTAMWLYPWDLADEGIPAVLDRVQRDAGLGGVNVATLYHAGKFLLPHNPRRKVYFPQSATLYTPAEPTRYAGLKVQPQVWSEATTEFWQELRRETRRRGMTMTAWMLGAHMSGLGQHYPDLTVENPFGDRIPTDLCPANPDLVAFLTAVAGDLAANWEFDCVLVESLEYMPFRHGFHHEVVGVPTTPAFEFLISLCFCPHCQRRATDAGLDAGALRRWVRAALQAHLEDPFRMPLTRTWPELKAGAGGEIGAFLSIRQEAVRSAVNAVAQAVKSYGVRFAALDFGPLFGMGPDGRSWQNGVDLDWLLTMVDEIHPTFYFTDAELHRRKVAEYAGLIGGRKPIIGALRSVLPQTHDAESLRVQVATALPHVQGLTFYNYGFMAWPAFGWIRQAVGSIGGGGL